MRQHGNGKSFDPFFEEGCVHGIVLQTHMTACDGGGKVLIFYHNWAQPIGGARYPGCVWPLYRTSDVLRHI